MKFKFDLTVTAMKPVGVIRFLNYLVSSVTNDLDVRLVDWVLEVKFVFSRSDRQAAEDLLDRLIGFAELYGGAIGGGFSVEDDDENAS